MRDQDRLDLPTCDRFEIRQRIFTGLLGMHTAIEHQSMVAHLEVIRIRTNLRAACQVNEFQMQFLLVHLSILLSVAQFSEQSLSRLV